MNTNSIGYYLMPNPPDLSVQAVGLRGGGPGN